MTIFVDVGPDLILCAEEVVYFHKYVYESPTELSSDNAVLKALAEGGGREGHNTYIHFKHGGGLWTSATVKQIRDALVRGVSRK